MKSIDELKTRRDGAIAARGQLLAQVNAMEGQIALLNELIADAEKPKQNGGK